MKRSAQEDRILVETSGQQGQSGKYAIDYQNDIFFVSISQLNVSDSGRYRCGVGNASSPDLLEEFQLKVTKGEETLNKETFLPGR